MKPTYGRVSTRGVIPLSWSLDHIGPICRSVTDAALLFEGIAAAQITAQIWGDQYDKKISDILQVQSAIASTISEQLKVKLTGEQKRRVSGQHTDNSEAYKN